MALLNVKTNAELDQEAAATAELEAQSSEEAQNTSLLDDLSRFIMERWERAKTAKSPITLQMLKMLNQKNGHYESDKLAAIRSMGGSEAFIMMTDTKCRSGKAWIKDVLFQPGMKPWDVEPTPIPELPEQDMMEISQEILMNSVNEMLSQSMTTGMPVDLNMIKQQAIANMPAMKDQIQKAINARAKENAKKVRDKIDDQLTQGGWYDALDRLIDDIVDQKAAFLKGPIFRSEKTRKMTTDALTGASRVIYEDKVIPTYERRSPFDIFPAPDSTGINDGYLFDRIRLTRRDLIKMIGMPGYKEDAIRQVLREHTDGKLHDWLNLSGDNERLLAMGMDSSALTSGEKIDCLEFWGTVNGKALLEYGMTPEEIADPDIDYDVCAWVIGQYVLKCILNYDAQGKKPYFKVSFVEETDAFWGKCVPELMADIQGICNAIVRAMVNNVGVASGPQVEMNMDRCPPGTSDKLWPWRVWKTTDQGMTTAPAMKFYNVPMNADKLVMVYNHFSKLADEHCGIPGYAHGDSSVGGAGNTASGLSMLMTSAARGIKAVIRAIDVQIIAPSIEYIFYWNLDNGELDDMICDMNIEAKGSSSLIAREQQAVRINEFLTTTNNPVDLQIIGLEGRADLLLQAAKANEINVRGLESAASTTTSMTMGMPMNPAAPGMPPGGPGTPGAPPAGPATLDAAGNKAQGEDTRLIPQSAQPHANAAQ
jgi:hypothetical protein